MKQLSILFLSALLGLSAFAQVSIYPPPGEGYEQRIRDFIDSCRVVDTHEHLANPRGIANGGMNDFMLLVHHYADDDIVSGGMPKMEFRSLLTDSFTVAEKWQRLKPYWEQASNTAYSKAAILSMKELFGVDELNDSTVLVLSEKIKQAYRGNWLETVLYEKAKIDYVIADIGDRSFGDPARMRYVKRFDYFRIDSKEALRAIGTRNDMSIGNLDDLNVALEKEFEAAIQKGFVAVKVGIAYHRPLNFDDVSTVEAQAAFERIAGSKDALPFEKVKALSDYMMHRIIALARKHHKPIQIHTGLQAGDGNLIENSNPTLLAKLFLQYRDVTFVLFHGGYPFGGELASLGKNFQNVYIDLCWLYVISPSYSERYLHEWLETIPANKITGFGGDYHNVENVYGHLLFARQIIGNVLIEKVRDGYFTEDEAIRIARMLLHDNAMRLYELQ